MKKKILAITAHADDHVMFAGTILKLQDMGYEYYEVVLTDSDEGEDLRRHRSRSKEDIAAMRMSELTKAARFLNMKKLYTLHEEDQNLVYTKNLAHTLVKIIRDIRPDIGISMNQDDIHPDHVVLSRLAREAFRWAAKNFRSNLGKPHRTTQVFFSEGTLPIRATFLVDITKYYDRKEELFKLYASQASAHDLSLLKSFAIIRGCHLRRKESMYAEAFSTEQNILPILFE